MTDIPEADLAEQESPAYPEAVQEQAAPASSADDVVPSADEADAVEQAAAVPLDDDDQAGAGTAQPYL